MFTVSIIRIRTALFTAARRCHACHRALDGDEAQATVEYALVVLAAATVALLVVAWAARTGRVGELFDRVFDRATTGAG